MKIRIDDKVHQVFPELKIFFDVIKSRSIAAKPQSLNAERLVKYKLNEKEVAEYQAFRQKIAGDDQLAVERLKNFKSEHDLPAPDPLTSRIIQASYLTDLPITIFSADKFDSILVRFSDDNDVLDIKDHSETIKLNSLVASTECGVLGVLGIKSSSLGKLSDKSGKLVILSFSCSQNTGVKSEGIVRQMIKELGEKK